MPWFIGNDQVLEVTGLSDPVTGEFLNNVTVTATMKDHAGQEVEGQNWPLTLQYEEDSDGVYRGVLEDTRQLAEGNIYWLELRIEAGGGLVGFWRWREVATYREPGQ